MYIVINYKTGFKTNEISLDLAEMAFYSFGGSAKGYSIIKVERI
jgi:hypothetical protein